MELALGDQGFPKEFMVRSFMDGSTKNMLDEMSTMSNNMYVSVLVFKRPTLYLGR